jgi:F-type H+-transporting ATPase subunit b
VHLSTVLGWTAEGEASWRATYDLVMMWVNFGILAFLLVKYARAPLLNLLKGEAEKTAAGLQQAQAGKEQADQKVAETMQALETARERLQHIQEKIIAQGARQRQQIIDSARQESRLLLERTRHKIDAQIAEAHLRIRSELIDRAVAVALERLPAEITAEEQLRLVDRFVRDTRST